MPKTLFLYLSKTFVKIFFAISLLIIIVLIISQTLDIMHRSKSASIPLIYLLQLILYKIPYLLQETIILISLISGLLFFDKLTKSNELIIIQNIGASIWQIMLPLILSSFCIGVTVIAIINPIATILLERHEKLETTYLNKSSNLVSMSNAGLMIKENIHNGSRVTIADKINLTDLSFTDTIMLELDHNNQLIRRIHSKYTKLNEKEWLLNDIAIFRHSTPETLDKLNLKTNMSFKKILSSFATPEIISFWKLPKFISNMRESGFVVLPYQSYYYKLVTKPLFIISTIFIASCFINIHARENHNSKMVVKGIITGFSLHFIAQISVNIITSFGVHPLFAATIPIILILLVCQFMILHTQEA